MASMFEFEVKEEKEADAERENFDPSNNYVAAGPVEIDQLQDAGINVADIKKLKQAGLYTLSSIIMSTSRFLTSIKGLSEVKVAKIVESVKKLQNFGFVSGKSVQEKRQKVIRISTGSTALNELLRGGIETMAITEVFGEFRTGKTQLCHTLCVTGQLPLDQKGGNGKVIYIDTEGTFRPERIIEIANVYGVDADSVLNNISVARAFTHEHQMDLLVGVAAQLIESPHSLLIVDSATALFRVDFSGRGQLADRQQKLGQFLSKLTKLAEEYNIAVVITNQVVSDPGGGAMFVADAKKPIGGHVMAHASTTRLMLRKGVREQRVCKIYDSPSLPESEAIYQLGEGGVVDAKD